MKEISKLIMLD